MIVPPIPQSLRTACAAVALSATATATGSAQRNLDYADQRGPLRAPSFSAVTRTSTYITARDGTRLAADLYLPEGHPVGERLPAVLQLTRSWRSLEARHPPESILDRLPRLVELLVPRGYAVVAVDVRGTGASFGARAADLSTTEVRDGVDIVGWLVAQPWSNGRIGASGDFYAGMAAEALLQNQLPPVRAIAPGFAPYDLFAELLAPGGIELRAFTRAWADSIRLLDLAIPAGSERRRAARLGVRPVDGDSGERLLRQAVRAHAGNVDVGLAWRGLVYRDDVRPGGYSPDLFSPHRGREAALASRAMTYSYAGWWDGAMALSAIHRFRAQPSRRSRLLVGPWAHLGARDYDVDAGSYAADFDLDAEMVRFFDWTLKGLDNELTNEPPVRYFTLVENRWKTALIWPPKARREVWYLEAGGLTLVPPSRRPGGSDKYRVDTTATTGLTSRWRSVLNGGKIGYPDRLAADQKLLTYTSTPFLSDVEVTGHPTATIYLTSSASDATVFVYLEDVAPDGRVSYITEGELRGVHRALGRARPPYPIVGPYHTLLRRDGRPLKPGQPAEFELGLLPTSYLVRRGHRIRLALSGADRDHFVSATEEPATLEIFRTARLSSKLVLPVVPRP